MATIHINSCPVCRNNGFSVLHTCKDYLTSDEVFSILICDKCRFAFTQDFPSEDVIGKYYDAPEYISHSDSQKGIINSLYHLARKITLRSKTKLVTKNSAHKTGKLLDIGSGTGYFLNQMKKNKWIVTGIEKSETARSYAKSKFDLDSQNPDYLFEIPEKAKDVVTMWHVLEHLENLNETMATIHKILKQDGIAVIALPNKDSFDAQYYKEYWAAYDVPRHLWHFSPVDFLSLAEKHGFVPEEMKPMYFDAFYISLLSEKNKGTFCASLIGLIKGGVFFLRSLFNTKKCSSLVYILTKK